MDIKTDNQLTENTHKKKKSPIKQIELSLIRTQGGKKGVFYLCADLP